MRPGPPVCAISNVLVHLLFLTWSTQSQCFEIKVLKITYNLKLLKSLIALITLIILIILIILTALTALTTLSTLIALTTLTTLVFLVDLVAGDTAINLIMRNSAQAKVYSSDYLAN